MKKNYNYPKTENVSLITNISMLGIDDVVSPTTPMDLPQEDPWK